MRKTNKEQIVFELEALPPDLRDLPRECCPRQAENNENRRGELSSPAAWSSPGVGAQVASLQSLVLRPGPNQCSGAHLATRHPFSRKGVSRPQERSLLRPLFQAHPALDGNSDFEFTPHWNETHIPSLTAGCANARHGKTQIGFPLSRSPQPMSTPAFLYLKSKTKERKSAAARPLHPDCFQDHLVLETLPAFRIILRLENAAAAQCESRFHCSAPSERVTQARKWFSHKGNCPQ